MPYADPDKQREAQARWYRAKYSADAAFREAEAERKAKWLQTEEGRASNAEASALHRAQKAKTKKGVIARFTRVT